MMNSRNGTPATPEAMLVSLVDNGDIALAKIAHPPYLASVSRYSSIVAGVTAKYRATGPSSQLKA